MTAKKNAKVLNLVPYPQSVRLNPGRYDLDEALVAVDSASAKAVCIRHKLKTLGLKATRGDVGNHTVIIGEPSVARLLPPQRAEAYVLRCDKNGVAVRGYDLDGLFWGLVTLEQLLADGRTVPCVSIRDYPEFGLRYHHDDISRKQVSKLADFKRIIGHLSRYKVKYYTPYIEDMLFLRHFPDIGEGRGRLTQAEVKGLLAEAKRHNVKVFPTYSLIGHQENLLSNPKYRKYAKEVFQPPSSYDPSKKILRPYLKKVIADVCELFPEAPFFHACFDETQGVEGRDLIDHANWCAKEIAKHGKQMMMWVDMFKNHYGLSRINELADNIVLVEWDYGNPQQSEQAYRDAGVTPTGLAAYHKGGGVLPDFKATRRNITDWARMMKRMGGEGFGCSTWGHEREACWNMYAFNGEMAWRGKPGPRDFERRFQNTFYGAALPLLEKIIEDLPGQRRIGSKRLAGLFSVPESGLVRLVTKRPRLAANARHDKPILTKALRSLESCRRRAVRERGHLDNFEVALTTEIDVCERLLLADRLAHGLSGAPLRAAVDRAIERLENSKRRFREVWLQCNKRPNIEVRLAPYDLLVNELRHLAAPPPAESPRYRELDLAPCANTFVDAVAGVPLGRRSIHGVPFQFVSVDKTHVAIAPGDCVRVPIDPVVQSVKDVHLIYGGQTLDHKDHADFVEVALLKGDKVVFREKLKNIKDICCWWAPMGEHIWAGGGYRYVNQKRNRLALKPAPMYGLMHLNGFRIPKSVAADALRISGIGKETLALFAATVETA